MHLSRNGNRSLPLTLQALARKQLTPHTLFMTACCAAIVAGTGLLIYSAPSGLTWSETLLLVAPVIGCLAMHALMHRFMGTPCPSPKTREPNHD